MNNTYFYQIAGDRLIGAFNRDPKGCITDRKQRYIRDSPRAENFFDQLPILAETATIGYSPCSDKGENNMTFRYRIIKKSIGTAPYTTRPDLGPALTQAEVVRQLSSFTALTEGEVTNVFNSLFQVLLTAALAGRPTEILFGGFRISLSCGGAIDDLEQTLTIEDINPQVTIHLGSSFQKRFLADVTLERTGVVGEKVPEIDYTFNSTTESNDTYTPGGPMRIVGDHLKFSKSDSQQGIFFRSQTDGTEVRASLYIEVTNGNTIFIVPSEVTGDQKLIVRVKYGNNLRETVYQATLPQE
ncbi:MAG: DUF4469 domain-containing protein [Hormoscilla sp.]